MPRFHQKLATYNGFNHIGMVSQEMLARARRGYYSGCCSESKWERARLKYKWDEVAEIAPSVANRYDEVPNWLKARLFEDAHLKGRQACKEIPKEILAICDSILQEECLRGLEMDKLSVEMLIKTVVETYNAEAEAFNKSRSSQHIESLDARLKDGEIDEETLEKESGETPGLLPLVGQDLKQSAMDRIVNHFCRRWGYSMFRQERPSKHLTRDHPAMQRFQEYFHHEKVKYGVCGRLVLNFDQVWTCTLPCIDLVCFTFPQRVFTFFLFKVNLYILTKPSSNDRFFKKAFTVTSGLYEPRRKVLWKNGDGEKDAISGKGSGLRRRVANALKARFHEPADFPGMLGTHSVVQTKKQCLCEHVRTHGYPIRLYTIACSVANMVINPVSHHM